MTFRLDQRLPDSLRAQGIKVVTLGPDHGRGSNWLNVASSFTSRPVGQANHWDGIPKGIDPNRWAEMLQHFARFKGAATYNGGIYDTGVVYLWAAGKTVNVGKVDSRRVTQVKAGQVTSKSRGSGDMWGNSSFLGWVLRNSGGKADPITDAQKRSLVVLNATCCDLYGLEPVASVMHRELTSRKIDIAKNRFGNTDLRASVANYQRTGPGAMLREEGDPMATSDIPQWEWERRAISRLEQLYRRHRTPTSVPDKSGYDFWVDKIEEVAHLGPDAIGTVVLAAVKAGLKAEEASR